MKKHQTLLMGILNVTPDSFYDKSRFFSIKEAVIRTQEMIKEGADLIDIGGESSRPGSLPISLEEEMKRVIPVIKELKKLKLKIPLSIDTTKPKIAQLALENGASFLNDIKGLSNPYMIEIAKSFDCDVCIMHMQKKPQTMQINPLYKKGVMEDLLKWFDKRISKLLKANLNESKIIIDPGIGFGKTFSDNLEIIKNIKKFKQAFGYRLLLGISRKSFMGKILNKKPPQDFLLPSTLALNALLIKEKVNIIRVHDVKEHRDLINLISHLT